MPVLYDNKLSRNGYKIRLLAAHAGLALQRIEIDILKGETRTREFVSKNVAGRIPVLELEDGTNLAESNAILYYLAQGTSLWPANPLDQTDVLRWMFFEQNSIECTIGTARFWKKLGRDKERADAFAHRMEASLDGLSTLDAHLAERQWVAADRFTIADIALYGYVSVAPDAGIELGDFPAVSAWLRRIESLPGHIGPDIKAPTTQGDVA
jgi:glutathione S-transferase